MNIIYALTHNFYEKAIPSWRSLLEYNPDAEIYLLGEDDEIDVGIPIRIINVSGIDTFRNSVNINNQFGGYINLIKVLYPEILPLDRVIHLDADTIICDSLEPMWETDLTGKWLGMVQEYRGHYRPFGEVYYNAGVMVMNLQQLRDDNIIPWQVDYLNNVRQPYVDQDAFNKPGLEQDKIVPLPIRYNENMMTGQTDNPAIVHYCGFPRWYDGNIPRGEYLKRWK